MPKETVDHVLILCPRYEEDRNELQRELQNLGSNTFSICNILNTKQGSDKLIKTVLKCIKNSGLKNRIQIDIIYT